MKKITKAVFPVAGIGTRFLPATKVSPKEMLPIVDKPLVQYAVEEAIAAGITELIFITGRTKRSITKHFDKAYEFENELKKKGQHENLKIVKNIIPEGVTCIFIKQAEPGLSIIHPVSATFVISSYLTGKQFPVPHTLCAQHPFIDIVLLLYILHY